MNAWIDRIAEMVGMENMGISLSLSDLSMLVPDGRWLLVAGAVVAFCLVAAYQDMWLGDPKDRHRDRHGS